MRGTHGFSGLGRLRGIALTTLAAILLTVAGRAILPWDRMFPDVICYWTAGKILAAGQNPYDAALQTEIQQDYGWDKATRGFGLFDYLPYYYPPWFGLLWVLLVPLGYAAAKTVWFFVNIECTLLAGYLLRRSVPGVPAWVPMVVAPLFLFSVACVVLGQTALVIFFLIVLLWRLLEQRQDAWAGVALAWLTIKPQLTVVLILGILLWAVRQRRWRVLLVFFATVVLLCLISALIVPSWLAQMWGAIRHTPSPTAYYPWIGNSWLLVLKAFALPSWLVYSLYLGGALLFLGTVLMAAANPKGPLAEVLGASILAAFFVAPYARHYDFPPLLIPALILLGNRVKPLLGAALGMALVIIPYIQLYLLASRKAPDESAPQFVNESTYFWVPLLLAVAWFTLRNPLSSRNRFSFGHAPARLPDEVDNQSRHESDK